jgi:hypothetical protein
VHKLACVWVWLGDLVVCWHFDVELYGRGKEVKVLFLECSLVMSTKMRSISVEICSEVNGECEVSVWGE